MRSFDSLFNPALLVASLLLAGCAVTPYQPYAGGVGYSEVNTARNRYEVVYHGTRGMDEATAKSYAIYRAAEIGRQNGYTHFRIAAARHDAVRSLESDADLFPRRPWTGEAQRMTEWEWRREQELEASRRRLSVREERAPVVALTVEFAREACETCLSVEEKLVEARAKGILRAGE